jgi:hypothetical protein
LGVNFFLHRSVVLHLFAVLALPSMAAATEPVSPVAGNDRSGGVMALQLPSRWAAPSSLSTLMAGHTGGKSVGSWSSALANAAKISIIEQGVNTSKQALLDCQKGEYPGGGMGVLSLPHGRPSAITDHCRH